MKARARKLAVTSNVLVLVIEVLALVSSGASLLSATALGQLLVVASAAAMLAGVLRGTALRDRSGVLLVLLSLAGATIVLLGGRHRAVDIVQWLAVVATGIFTLVEERARARKKLSGSVETPAAPARTS